MIKEGRRDEQKGGPKFFEIDRLLASHRDRYPPAKDPPNTLLLAYEDRRFKKMARQLLECEDELKSKILVELVQDLVNSTKIVRAAMKTDMMEVLGEDFEWHQEKKMDLPPVQQADMIEVLVLHLSYENDEIRELAAKAVVDHRLSRLNSAKSWLPVK
jgi:hypothetical protein